MFIIGITIGILALALLTMQGLDATFIPGIIDAARHIEDSVTKTASYNGSAQDLGSGFAPGGLGEPLAAVINITAIDRTTGDETYLFHLEESANNSDWSVCGPVISTTTTGSLAIPGFVSSRYIRVAAVLSGTTPSVTYSTDLTFIEC